MDGEQHMTLEEAIKLATAYTKDINNQASANTTLWDMIKALLDHCLMQQKDIADLTKACQVLLRENLRLQEELNK